MRGARFPPPARREYRTILDLLPNLPLVGPGLWNVRLPMDRAHDRARDWPDRRHGGTAMKEFGESLNDLGHNLIGCGCLLLVLAFVVIFVGPCGAALAAN